MKKTKKAGQVKKVKSIGQKGEVKMSKTKKVRKQKVVKDPLVTGISGSETSRNRWAGNHFVRLVMTYRGITAEVEFGGFGLDLHKFLVKEKMSDFGIFGNKLIIQRPYNSLDSYETNLQIQLNLAKLAADCIDAWEEYEKEKATN